MNTEQAQTVAEIRAAHEERFDGHIRRDESIPRAEKAVMDLLQIIDSQAAEVERLTKERDEAREKAKSYRDMYCVKSPNPAKLPWEKAEAVNYET
jgi:hypothetical protein